MVIARASHSTSAEVAARIANRDRLTAGDAAAIASWYQSPRGHGAVFAALASGADVDRVDLLDALSAELASAERADRPALRALMAYARR